MRSLVYFVATFVVALILGIGSAWYMIDGSPSDDDQGRSLGGLAQRRQPERRLLYAGARRPERRLPLTSTVARYFVARTDDNGRALAADCTYLITGRPLNARWWSVALYDEYGGLIANSSGRYSFNSEELLRHADGSYRINLARNARPRIGCRPERSISA